MILFVVVVGGGGGGVVVVVVVVVVAGVVVVAAVAVVVVVVVAVGGCVIWVAFPLVPVFPSVCAIVGTHRSRIPTIGGLVVPVVVVATISCRSLVSCGPRVEHGSNPFDARVGCFAS